MVCWGHAKDRDKCFKKSFQRTHRRILLSSVNKIAFKRFTRHGPLQVGPPAGYQEFSAERVVVAEALSELVKVIEVSGTQSILGVHRTLWRPRTLWAFTSSKQQGISVNMFCDNTPARGFIWEAADFNKALREKQKLWECSLCLFNKIEGMEVM